MAAHYQKNKGCNQMLQRFGDRSHKNDNTDTKRLSCIAKISKSHCNSQVKPDTKNWSYKTSDLLKRGSIHMKFSMTGQEKGDL